MDLRANEVVTEGDYVLFWDGWPSQWYPCPFEVEGIQYNCCEQCMMAEKARVFADSQALIAILESKSPRHQKALGRQVANFNPELWERICRGIVYTGNLAKFSQTAELKQVLVDTGSKTIVEASPTDRIWGIGLTKEDPKSLEPWLWRGTNWLGVAIMQVRDTLNGRPLDVDLAKQLAERKAL